eukprot:5471666-Pleurochrysis_carterae.AAC.1
MHLKSISVASPLDARPLRLLLCDELRLRDARAVKRHVPVEHPEQNSEVARALDAVGGGWTGRRGASASDCGEESLLTEYGSRLKQAGDVDRRERLAAIKEKMSVRKEREDVPERER